MERIDFLKREDCSYAFKTIRTESDEVIKKMTRFKVRNRSDVVSEF